MNIKNRDVYPLVENIFALSYFKKIGGTQNLKLLKVTKESSEYLLKDRTFQVNQSRIRLGK